MRHRIYVRRGLSRSLGNYMELFSGLFRKTESWIEVEERQRGIFSVVANNMTYRTVGYPYYPNPVSLGFCQWDSEVLNLTDPRNDGFQCFRIANHLKWEDVYLTPYEIRSPALGRLWEALKHVTWCAWDPTDI